MRDAAARTPAHITYAMNLFFTDSRFSGARLAQGLDIRPCWLRGSDEMMRAIKDRYQISSGQTSACGRFSLLEVECLGACVNAPILQVNDDFYEDLDYQSTGALLDSLEADAPLTVGSIIGRSGSESTTGATTLALSLIHI